MPFDGFNYPSANPVWEDRLRRLAKHTAGLEWINIRCWGDCAIGTAIDYGVFKAEGLHWSAYEGIPALSPTVKGWTAVALFFGMTKKEARKLFCARWFERSPTPQVMAKRIHAYIDQRWMAMAA